MFSPADTPKDTQMREESGRLWCVIMGEGNLDERGSPRSLKGQALF